MNKASRSYDKNVRQLFKDIEENLKTIKSTNHGSLRYHVWPEYIQTIRGTKHYVRINTIKELINWILSYKLSTVIREYRIGYVTHDSIKRVDSLRDTSEYVPYIIVVLERRTIECSLQ